MFTSVENADKFVKSTADGAASNKNDKSLGTYEIGVNGKHKKSEPRSNTILAFIITASDSVESIAKRFLTKNEVTIRGGA